MHKFGVHNEYFGDTVTNKLGTGDGKTEVSTIVYPDEERIGFMISYGTGTGCIGTFVDHNRRPVEECVNDENRETLLIIDFINPDSVDAFIVQLQDVKSKLVKMQQNDADKWDNRELGADEEFVKLASDEEHKSLKAALGKDESDETKATE